MSFVPKLSLKFLDESTAHILNEILPRKCIIYNSLQTVTQCIIQLCETYNCLDGMLCMIAIMATQSIIHTDIMEIIHQNILISKIINNKLLGKKQNCLCIVHNE